MNCHTHSRSYGLIFTARSTREIYKKRFFLSRFGSPRLARASLSSLSPELGYPLSVASSPIGTIDSEIPRTARARFEPSVVGIFRQSLNRSKHQQNYQRERAQAGLRGGRLSVIGNLPYYITSQILFTLVDHSRSIRRAARNAACSFPVFIEGGGSPQKGKKVVASLSARWRVPRS